MGISKNNNKRLSNKNRVSRYAPTKKVQRGKTYTKKVISRDELEGLAHKEVHVNAEVHYLNRKDPHSNVLLKHVYVNDGIYIEHVWVTLTAKERRKLKLWDPSHRLLCVATVMPYWKTKGNTKDIKYGLTNIKLMQS